MVDKTHWFLVRRAQDPTKRPVRPATGKTDKVPYRLLPKLFISLELCRGGGERHVDELGAKEVMISLLDNFRHISDVYKRYFMCGWLIQKRIRKAVVR